MTTTMPCAIENTSANAKPVLDSTTAVSAVMLEIATSAPSMSVPVTRDSRDDSVKYHVSLTLKLKKSSLYIHCQCSSYL